jgi:transposase
VEAVVIDYETFCKIHDCHDRQGLTIAQTARALGLHPQTVATWVARSRFEPRRSRPRGSVLDPFKQRVTWFLDTSPYNAQQIFKHLCEEGYRGGATILRDYIRVIANLQPRFDAFKWMNAVLQKKIKSKELKNQLGDILGLEILLNRLYAGGRFDRNKSMAILARRRGITIKTICSFLGTSNSTYRSYTRAFALGGSHALFSRKPRIKKCDDEVLKSEIFRVLHQPPSNYGINRTSWTMPLLRKVLSENGSPVCPDVIRSITWAAKYRWRKARVVLTSTDPTYSEKLDRIHSILSGLKSDEVFFSIDEYGPFAVKMYGGRKLVASGEQHVVPQWQTSRGSLIITAAIELSTNQITHFYSNKKNTDEMVKMMEVLISNYAERRKIYLSWDAASWHISKLLNRRIEEHNNSVAFSGGVVVETAPLPSGAQFLNVIESVFSGMSRAIIHNSNYPSLGDAKAAIDRHFKDRNSHFQTHPQKAGKKIWGKEPEPATFSDSSNCKDPRYR